jgi:hypothetical protein
MAAAENVVLIKYAVSAAAEGQRCHPSRGQMLGRRLMVDSPPVTRKSAVLAITRRM